MSFWGISAIVFRVYLLVLNIGSQGLAELIDPRLWCAGYAYLPASGGWANGSKMEAGDATLCARWY